MDTNTSWLKEKFALPHLAHIELEESFVCKWFYVKHGRAFYNPKQAPLAKPMEFKLFVLEILYNHMRELRNPIAIPQAANGKQDTASG